MTNVVIEKINTTTANIIGKTFDSTSYSGDAGSREKIKGQTFITSDDIKDGMTVRGEGNDTPIRKVEAVEKIELRVQLLNAESLDDGKSLATVFLRGVWKAKGVENPELDEIFVMAGSNDAALSELNSIALALSRTPTGARALGKWYPATMDGKRVIIRVIGPINKNGKIDQKGDDSPMAEVPF